MSLQRVFEEYNIIYCLFLVKRSHAERDDHLYIYCDNVGHGVISKTCIHKYMGEKGRYRKIGKQKK